MTTSEICQTFSQRLSMLRKGNLLSQQEIGDATNIAQQVISHLENKRKVPSVIQLIAIAEYFDVSTDYLLGRDS